MFFRRYYCVYQWMDGSMNYHADFDPNTEYPACGLYLRKESYNIIRWKEATVACNTDTFKHLPCLTLCEKTKTAQQDPSTRGIQLDPAIFPFTSIPLANCSGRQRTHEFLACEPSSECVPNPQSQRVSSLCPRTLFTCQKNQEYVPYTLVCDCRHDCSDGSDEDFCVYNNLESSAKGSSQCFSRQVLFLK